MTLIIPLLLLTNFVSASGEEEATLKEMQAAINATQTFTQEIGQIGATAIEETQTNEEIASIYRMLDNAIEKRKNLLLTSPDTERLLLEIELLSNVEFIKHDENKVPIFLSRSQEIYFKLINEEIIIRQANEEERSQAIDLINRTKDGILNKLLQKHQNRPTEDNNSITATVLEENLSRPRFTGRVQESFERDSKQTYKIISMLKTAKLEGIYTNENFPVFSHEKTDGSSFLFKLDGDSIRSFDEYLEEQSQIRMILEKAQGELLEIVNQLINPTEKLTAEQETHEREALTNLIQIIKNPLHSRDITIKEIQELNKTSPSIFITNFLISINKFNGENFDGFNGEDLANIIIDIKDLDLSPLLICAQELASNTLIMESNLSDLIAKALLDSRNLRSISLVSYEEWIKAVRKFDPQLQNTILKESAQKRVIEKLEYYKSRMRSNSKNLAMINKLKPNIYLLEHVENVTLDEAEMFIYEAKNAEGNQVRFKLEGNTIKIIE